MIKKNCVIGNQHLNILPSKYKISVLFNRQNLLENNRRNHDVLLKQVR